ncbi:YceI family protein [Sulfurirhabdus autotrophica]|uniref:Polyisoprenoid-binding protein YceI n=1 Tax=Sulfurirhabdus autotrophica TaxID=1706046 RepID=A0A4R3YEW4_9PROT|nr:YceI family protein [Sulfurirhabdus autotrophica]TCV89013.1 polyisoprenoid-binding protein YceI [Sulfurirhabdus autotrophica]
MKYLLITLMLTAVNLAQAAPFNVVQLEKSTITFVSKQMNVPVKGNFNRFTAQITFDKNKPEAGLARIEIDLGSIDAGSTEANDEVKGKAWFNTRDFPKALFVSSSVKEIGNGQYETTGKLSLKEKTLDIRAPFTIKQEKGVLIIDGIFPIKRLDYDIGSGIWQDTSVVANEVEIKFHFSISPAKK